MQYNRSAIFTPHEIFQLQAVELVISKYIDMEFEMDKATTMRIKREKICDMEGIEMLDGQQMKQIEESGCIYI